MESSGPTVLASLLGRLLCKVTSHHCDWRVALPDWPSLPARSRSTVSPIAVVGFGRAFLVPGRWPCHQPEKPSLLAIARLLGSDRGEVPQQAIAFIVRTGGEVEAGGQSIVWDRR